MPAPGSRELSSRISGFSVVSCDVFDTAISRRLARPEDVLLLTAMRLHAAGRLAGPPAAFVPLRQAAERHVRAEAEAAGSDEPTLAAVYERLAVCGVVADAAAAARTEFDAECAACVAVPAVRDALAARKGSQRLVFVSDTLLPGSWVAELLRGCGYGAECEVFSSADLGRSKHTGRLFASVLAALDVPAARVVHIGDNPVSDIARAGAAGLATVYLPWQPPPPEAQAVTALDPLVRLAHSRRRARGAAPPEEGAWLARQVALLVIGFALFVRAEARRRDIDRIYCLARDGYLPMLVLRRLLGDHQPTYLHVSRRSVVIPLADTIERLARALSESMQGQPLAEALHAVGLDDAETERVLRGAALDPAAPVSGHDAVHRALSAAGPCVAARMHELRADTLAYLDRSGFAAPGRRMIVDVGWRGTIQTALAALVGVPPGELAGAYLGLWPEALRPGLDPGNAAAYLFAFGHPAALTNRVREAYILLELIFSAPHGTVLGYAAGEPVHAAEAEPGARARLAALAAFEAECLAEFDALDALLGGAWPDGIDPASALFDLDDLMCKPTRAQVAAINRIPFVHAPNGKAIAAAVNPIPWHEFLRRPRASLRRLERAPWRAGAVRASLPWPLPSMSHAVLRHRLGRLLGLMHWPKESR